MFEESNCSIPESGATALALDVAIASIHSMRNSVTVREVDRFIRPP
jgi:hypothetical protein